ncbi:MAG: Hsp33 family molecular chaperone HslO [Pseudomonadota bacterium]
MTSITNDALQRFVLEGSNVRGELVHLDDTWRTILSRTDYPAPVRRVLGEALSAVALLSATIKYEGSLILQMTGDGPVNLLVVQARADRTLRGLARWRDVVQSTSLREQFGAGRLVMTVDPGPGMERYQSLINITADSIAELLLGYFDQSEQLSTRLWLTANEQSCAGMLLQRLPGDEDDEEDDEAWERAVILASTVQEVELQEAASEMVLARLFALQGVRVYEPESFRFHCGCSREVITTSLGAMPIDELREIIEEEGEIKVDCEFCGAKYLFDEAAVEALATEPTA